MPGMQVAQINALRAISVRGFNSAYAYKLLVLIDGRTMDSEIYSGAHWDQNDIPLDTVERIEVIRGPGAAVWGTNAVNGVINIITRRARGTTGVAVAARISRIDGTTTLQYGGSAGDRMQYRGFANYTDRRPFDVSTGDEAFDGEESVRGGGRLDWQRTSADWFTVSGDLYGGHLRQLVRSQFPVASGPDGEDSGSIGGGFLLGRWEHKLEHSDSALQVYFDDISRRELSSGPHTRTSDIDFQDHLALGSRNDLVEGGEFRFTDNGVSGAAFLAKPAYSDYLVDGFAQDELTVVPDRLVLTVGSKIQDGTLAGFQVQPSVRALWSPGETQSLWGAMSRAVVAPSIQDKQIQIPLNLGTANGLPITATLRGNPGFQPETVLAYEGGYRRRLNGGLTVDVAGFFNVYHRIQSLAAGAPAFVPVPAPHISLTLQYANGFETKTAGLEGALSWKPLSTLTLQGSYAWMQARTMQTTPGNLTLADSWSTPRNTLAVGEAWNFASKWGFNSFLYYADALPPDGGSVIGLAGGEQVSSNLRLDAHLVREVGRFVQLDAGGTNLLSPRHLEFGGGTAAITPAYVPRSIFLRATWAF